MKATDERFPELYWKIEEITDGENIIIHENNIHTVANDWLKMYRELQSLRKGIEQAVEEIGELLKQDEEPIEFVKGFDAGLKRALFYLKKHLPKE